MNSKLLEVQLLKLCDIQHFLVSKLAVCTKSSRDMYTLGLANPRIEF